MLNECIKCGSIVGVEGFDPPPSTNNGKVFCGMTNCLKDTDVLLKKLASPEMLEYFEWMPDGKEELIIKDEAVVVQLIEALKNDKNGAEKAEKFLDSIVKTKPPEGFEYTGAIIATLFALSESKCSGSESIISAFAFSKSAKVARARKFAKNLL